MIGLHGCTWALCSCGEWELLFVECRLFILVASSFRAWVLGHAGGFRSQGSHALEHRLNSRGARAYCFGSMWDPAPQIRNWTCASCIDRQTHHHWATREASFSYISLMAFSWHLEAFTRNWVVRHSTSKKYRRKFFSFIPSPKTKYILMQSLE